MPHVQIVGMTESGKTTLAKQMSCRYKQQQIGVIVLDPLHDPGWCADYVTDDPHEFLYVVRNSRRCAVFIDESGESVGRFDDEMFWLGTRARHYGHNSHFISQRAVQVAKTVRDQCGRLFLFNCSLEDSKTLANEWNKPILREAHTLRQGDFFGVSRFGPITKHNVFTGTDIAISKDRAKSTPLSSGDEPAQNLLDKNRANMHSEGELNESNID